MQQYGQTQTDDKQLSDIAENILKNEEERKKFLTSSLMKKHY